MIILYIGMMYIKKILPGNNFNISSVYTKGSRQLH